MRAVPASQPAFDGRQCAYDRGHSIPSDLRKHPMPKRLIIPQGRLRSTQASAHLPVWAGYEQQWPKPLILIEALLGTMRLDHLGLFVIEPCQFTARSAFGTEQLVDGR